MDELLGLAQLLGLIYIVLIVGFLIGYTAYLVIAVIMDLQEWAVRALNKWRS